MRTGLVRRRMALGLTQGQMAQRCHVSSATIRSAEIQGKHPRPASCVKLARGYGMSPEEFAAHIIEEPMPSLPW